MRLLFIRFSSIGDIVLTTPVIRCVKQQIPGVEIHFLTKLSMKEVTEANPYIDHFHYLDQDINELIPTFKKQSFDAVIDLHHNQRTWRIKRALGVKSFSYKEVTGYKDIFEEAIESNWFASEINETESILFYAFVKKENVELLFDLVSSFNEKQETLSHIHVAVLNIEKSN